MIDRVKLEKLLDDLYHNRQFENDYTDAIQDVSDNLDDCKMLWINPREQKPEEGDSVLVYLDEDTQRVGYYNVAYNSWWTLSGEFLGNHVIAWLPLPSEKPIVGGGVGYGEIV